MSISRHIATLFRVRANKALDRAEDPREILDFPYYQQLEMVQKARRGLADVATSRKRVELQVTQLELSAGKLQGKAQQALGAGRYRIMQSQRGLLLATVLRASTNVVIRTTPYRLTTR